MPSNISDLGYEINKTGDHYALCVKGESNHPLMTYGGIGMESISIRLITRQCRRYHLLWSDDDLLLVANVEDVIFGTNGYKPFQPRLYSLPQDCIKNGYQHLSTDNLLHVGAHLGRFILDNNDNLSRAALGILSLLEKLSPLSKKEKPANIFGKWWPKTNDHLLEITAEQFVYHYHVDKDTRSSQFAGCVCVFPIQGLTESEYNLISGDTTYLYIYRLDGDSLIVAREYDPIRPQNFDPAPLKIICNYERVS